MNLEVIGAGFGRTGTMSLKATLEELGFGPCYHMREVFEHPEHIGQWRAAMRGEPVDWERILGDYRATVDWPGCTFYDELLERNPDAKVILTVRDPQRWYESACDTIYRISGPSYSAVFRLAGLVMPRPGRSTAPAGSSPSSCGKATSTGGSRTGSTPSRPSSGTTKRSSGASRRRSSWSTRSSKDGARCATSWASRRRTSRSRTSTTAKPSGIGSGAYASLPPPRSPSASPWRGSSCCASAGADGANAPGATGTSLGLVLLPVPFEANASSLIHRSAWKGCSRKSACRMLHTNCPWMGLC